MDCKFDVEIILCWEIFPLLDEMSLVYWRLASIVWNYSVKMNHFITLNRPAMNILWRESFIAEFICCVSAYFWISNTDMVNRLLTSWIVLSGFFEDMFRKRSCAWQNLPVFLSNFFLCSFTPPIRSFRKFSNGTTIWSCACANWKEEWDFNGNSVFVEFEQCLNSRFLSICARF